MHSLDQIRRRPSQFIDRPLDAMPNSTAAHVAIGQEIVGTLGRV